MQQHECVSSQSARCLWPLGPRRSADFEHWLSTEAASWAVRPRHCAAAGQQGAARVRPPRPAPRAASGGGRVRKEPCA
eukprot:399527-Pyramimonas_sp.AAC.1